MIPLKDDVPSRSFPLVTLSLIIANVLVFFYELSLGPEAEFAIRRMGVIPYEITSGVDLPPPSLHPIYLTFFTSLFMHGGFAHLLGNMLYLWIFGDNVEDSMGHFRFLFFYLLCGVLASLAHVFSSMGSQIPTIGASGAIAGVLGAYLLLYPRASILTLIPFGYFMRMIRLPALLVLSFWFVLQLFYGMFSIPGARATGGVAWFAHIGGFLSGFLLIRIFRKRGRRRVEWGW